MIHILATVHILLIFLVAFHIWKKETVLKKVFWVALVLKLAAGICLGLLYTYYYSVSDTFVYFHDAGKLATLAPNDFPAYLSVLLSDETHSLSLTFDESRALFLTKITSLFSLVTGDNYWLISLYYSFISFYACWFLVKTLQQHIPSTIWAAVIAFLFSPSALFWTSGLLKESLAVASLYYLTAIFLKIWFKDRIHRAYYLVAVFGLWILWNLKYYYFAVFVPVAFTTLLYRYLVGEKLRSSPLKQVLVWAGLLILPVLLITLLHPNFDHDRLMNVIVTNNAAYEQLSFPGDFVRFQNLRPEPLSLLKNAPWALFSGLFRPLFWEASTILQFIAGVENTFILCLFLASLLHVTRYLSSSHRLLVLALVVYVVLLCIFITLSAPNFGTLSRYRAGFISFFVFIILCHNPLLQFLQRSFPGLLVSKWESTFTF
jgi:hypothetical protein